MSAATHSLGDKRMLRTREAIRRALLTLLQQKDTAEIRVSELSETAAISRRTFYLHYANVDDAVADLENEIEQCLLQEIRQSDVLWSHRFDLYQVFSRIDRALGQNKIYAGYLRCRRARYFVLYRLKNSVKALVLEPMKQHLCGTKEQVESAADFMVSGALSMYCEWLGNGNSTLQQLAETMQKMMQGAVGALLPKPTEKKE